MNEKILSLLHSEQLSEENKFIVLSNYFGQLCSDNRLLDILVDKRFSPKIAIEILRKYATSIYYGSNINLNEKLIEIIKNRNEYDRTLIEKVIIVLAYYDNLFLLDNYIINGNILKFEEYYGSITEYSLLVLGNNFARIKNVIKQLLEYIKYDDKKEIVMGGNLIVDILYIFAEKLKKEVSADLNKIISEFSETANFEKIKCIFSRMEAVFDKNGFLFLEYNNGLQSLHCRYRKNIEWPIGDASCKGDQFVPLKFIIDNSCPCILSEQNQYWDSPELTNFFGIVRGEILIFPCMSMGRVNGILVFHSDDCILYDELIEVSLVSKYLSQAIEKAEAEIETMRYFEAVLSQFSFASQSIQHETSPAFTRLKDAIISIEKNKSLTEEEKNKLSICHDAIDSIQDILKALLSFSSTSRKTRSINDVLSTVHKLLNVEIKKCNCEIDLSYDCGNPMALVGPGIYSIFSNLISNATKAINKIKNKDGRIKIITKAIESEKKVIVKVIDNGIGVPSNTRSKIFSLGYSDGGKGIGLALAKQLVNEMNGNIYLDENEKETTFVVELPLVTINV